MLNNRSKFLIAIILLKVRDFICSYRMRLNHRAMKNLYTLSLGDVYVMFYEFMTIENVLLRV